MLRSRVGGPTSRSRPGALPARRRGRAAGVATLGVAVLVLVGACASAGTTDEAQAPEQPQELAQFYDQELSWGPCADYAPTSEDTAAYADPELDCTRVTVPQAYAEPDGETMQIALLRKKATGDKIGSLFTDPGGPGASGTSFMAGQASTWSANGLGDRFDLIGFDPRGTGASLPLIECLTDQENDEDRTKVFADPSPEGVAAAEAHSRQFAERCTERTGAEVLANVGTRDVAKDMDILRAVVGDEKMTYAGFSYGTELGTAYAEAFPQNVRALLLDGAVDPTQTTIESTVKQNAGFQLAFDNFAKDCTSRQNCPLGTDPAQATAAFQTIMQQLIDNPVPAGDGRMLSFNDAQTGVSQALYVSQLWPALQQGISQVANGNGDFLMQLADLYHRRDAQGEYSNMLQAFQAITCVNQPALTEPAEALELATQAEEAAPFRSTGRGPVGARDACAFWPAPPTSEPHTPQVDGLPPVVVVSVTGDPATPYQAGVDLADQLGGSLISVNGEQHTASLQGDPCVDGLAIDYLVNLTVPGEGSECTLMPS
ncbi:alpha/beta hydrolase family protein [Pseudonocardia autotrophica]|uniref:Carboxylesterase A n=3 Tax=Pseudonocardiaceae TaxID=2070 RepID=A0A1Y2MNP1_PSEAH|nr:Carboxylesterase A precursor [Pseudonocardia autotrophica]TDN77134.1 alpha/beta hydrolase family protein [Pseudonocardia autotrophica]BBG01139.1 alpha/beta hydrolase [Pseudonocardia autotrophica]GEC26805.1 alpha/beta hydrolase [Pseudonocardia saturnea]